WRAWHVGRSPQCVLCDEHQAPRGRQIESHAPQPLAYDVVGTLVEKFTQPRLESLSVLSHGLFRKRSRATSGRRATVAERDHRMRASTFQLLCVEEHESQLRALKVLLERHGFHVDGAPSIEAARRLLDGATYDLVIADDGALRGTLPALFESGVLDPDR